MLSPLADGAYSTVGQAYSVNTLPVPEILAVLSVMLHH